MSQNFPKVVAKTIYEDFQSGKADKIIEWAKTHGDPAVSKGSEPLFKALKTCKNFDEFYGVLNGTSATPIKLSPVMMEALAGGKSTSKSVWQAIREQFN